MFQKCHRCSTTFERPTSKRRTYCKPCSRSLKTIRKEKNIAYIAWILQQSCCTDCKNDDWRVLQFDHISDKHRDIAKMVSEGYSLKTIQQEIDKCEIRCANCHMLVTAERGNFWRSALFIPEFIEE